MSVYKKKAELIALPTGYLFNLLLFLILFLPDKDLATFTLGPVITNLREVCLVLLPVVYFIYPRGKDSLSKQTKYCIVIFFAVVVATELIKKVQYGIAPFDAIKNFRLTLPLLSGLLVCLQGQKIDAKFCLKTILVALIISYVLTPLMVLLGIQPATFSAEGRQVQVEYLRRGRFVNDSFEFGLLGIALLFYLPKVKTVQKELIRLILFTSILSILTLILSFNRTVLAAGALLGVILLVTSLERKTLNYILLTIVIAGSIASYFYLTYPSIQQQVKRRILVVFQQDNGLAESVYYNNRDELYDIMVHRLNDYWLLGLPGGKALINTDTKISSKSDVSLYNIWILHGLLAFIVFIILLILIYSDQRKKITWLPKKRLSHQITKAVIVTFPFYVLVSFNVDTLVNHNAILFLILLITFYDLRTN